MIARCQSGLPAVGEVLEPFAYPHCVVGMGFQLAAGKLVGPRDLPGNNSFDRARQIALEVTDYIHQAGPFEPRRLPLDEMEYTTMPQVAELLADRWQSLDEPPSTVTR